MLVLLQICWLGACERHHNQAFIMLDKRFERINHCWSGVSIAGPANNKKILTGPLGDPPQLKCIGSGRCVVHSACTSSVALNVSTFTLLARVSKYRKTFQGIFVDSVHFYKPHTENHFSCGFEVQILL